MIELLGNLGNVGITLIVLVLGEVILRALGRLFGIYTIVRERECKVFVLFGQVLGVIDERAFTFCQRKSAPPR